MEAILIPLLSSVIGGTSIGTALGALEQQPLDLVLVGAVLDLHADAGAPSVLVEGLDLDFDAMHLVDVVVQSHGQLVLIAIFLHVSVAFVFNFFFQCEKKN